jgi:cysteinyl-tRNA synthetase
VTSPEVVIFNTMSLSKQAFSPRTAGQVTMYTCGPTVYRYAHIGNFRTYLMADFWIRALEYLGYRVTQVVNITDVGHLVDDHHDGGDDKVLLAAERERKSPQEIANFYTEAFMEDGRLVGIRPADHYPRASEHIGDMIALIQRLEEMGLTYTIGGNVYYDVKQRGDYPKLSHNSLDELQAGYRIEPNPDKRHVADFLLWKAAGPRRQQVWDSPWGNGFPGWHIECSAMSLKYFPDGFDIHTGGEDNVFPHHEDEIAQSEPVMGHQVVNYWIHGAFLQNDGRKMAKSTGNMLRVTDLDELGFDPLAFRYLCMSARYRAKLNFSLEAMAAAQRGLDSIRERASALAAPATLRSPKATQFQSRFTAAIADDLDLPQVSGLLSQLIHSDMEEGEKRTLLEDWDRVLRLDLTQSDRQEAAQPPEVKELARRREVARGKHDWREADRLRVEIEALGWEVRDTGDDTRLIPMSASSRSAR